MNNNKPVILLFCEHTSHEGTRSGIQRVVIETALALSVRADVRFVKWDAVDGQLRYLDARDLDGLFRGVMYRNIQPHSACHRVAYRFCETIENPERTWLLFPEIPYFVPGGNARFASIIAQCREYGVRAAAIFYDLIPVREPEYLEGCRDHLAYLIEMTRCDRIFAISRFSAEDLLHYFRETADLNDVQLAMLRERVVAVPLGEHREDEAWGLPLKAPAVEVRAPLMVLVGTIEPRKQQTRLLRVLNESRARHPELSGLQVEVFGSLHPLSAQELHEQLARNPRISYHQYASDALIEDAYARAWFSAFVSKHEGYGLPIVESVRRGVPCITASFGAMAEVAQGGGCLQVNVSDDSALQDALVCMVRDETLRTSLAQEISSRPRRSWGNYADDLIANMNELADRTFHDEVRFCSDLQSALEKGSSDGFLGELHGVAWTVAVDASGLTQNVAQRNNGYRALVLAGSRVHPDDWSAEITLTVAQADVIVCSGALTPEALVSAANRNEIDEMLPADITSGDSALEDGINTIVRISRQRQIAHQIAGENRLVCDLLSRFSTQLPPVSCELAIVISTFNRAGFVERNAEWVLAQIDRDNLPVKCVIVDNASTDDSFMRLQRFVSHPKFLLIQNANNTGMLGNLRVCAAGMHAPYVWLIGDDDFLVPGAIQRTLAVLRERPGLPLIIHNFGVYHRESMGSLDDPQQFILEMIRLAPTPRSDGVYRINEIGDEHDNLFTAIYPIVFRRDVLIACFNYPFDGVPFSNLTESVPTTKILLGTYRYCDAYWFAEPGIVGNAHNSWSGHRPRWHLVLMPQVLQLAREAGVAPHKLWAWLRVHKQLFDEAVGIAIQRNIPAHIVIPDDIVLSLRNFREPVNIDARLQVFDEPPAPYWRLST